MTSYTYKKSNNYIMNTNICQNCEILNARITCLEYEIIELKQENNELKEEIKELKQENKELKQENKELKQENKELKERISILENDNKQLKFDKIKNKLLTAIQDINKNDQLENKYNFLYKIRKYRNNINHYINEEFDTNENIINYKKLLLKNKLLQLTEIEIEIFNKRYNINNLVNIILEYLNTLDLYYDNLDEDDIIDANNWWLD